MKKGFTLIEMLVVIAIIGVLAGILIGSFSGGTEAARAAKCLANMRNLAQGAISYASRTDHFPYAGSFAAVGVDSNGKTTYYERTGWISWLSQNDEYGTRRASKAKPTSFISLKNISAYCTDEKKSLFCMTNGALWTAVNCNRETYVCPAHQLKARKKGITPRWSYVMSAYFGYDSSNGSEAECSTEDCGVWMNSGRLERKLLFAELPINGDGPRIDEGNGSGSANASYATGDGTTSSDCVLQYKASYNGKDYNKSWKGTAESIAFNHKSGKRWCAHVVFADGHTEKLLKPKSGGLSDEQLTALLCGGVDVAFDGSKYELIKKGDE